MTIETVDGCDNCGLCCRIPPTLQQIDGYCEMAIIGDDGKVFCKIYENRPMACKDFRSLYEY